MTRVDLLRLMLPPARHIGTAPVRCAWRTPEGAWQSEKFGDMAAVAARFQPRRVEVCPHPADVSMTQIELPPLAARRQRIAVLGAVELLALASPGGMVVGFGPRNDKGLVTVAWMGANILSTCLRTLQDHGLPAHAVYPPPAFLPSPREGAGAEAAAAVVDDWAIVRTGPDEGTLHPVAAVPADLVQLGARLQTLLPGSPSLHWWQGDDAAVADPARTEMPGFGTGMGWRWTLPAGQASAEGAERRWLLPAVGWALATAAVWVLGINLHASQLAAQGKALTRQMAAQVKAAYPELPVVLNPLQQARQLRDARNAGAGRASAGAGAAAPEDFASLMRACAGLLAQAEGQVEHVDFRDGQLKIQWREGATPSPSEVKSLQERAQAHGLVTRVEDGGLRVQAVAATKEDGLAPPASSTAGTARAPGAATSGAAR